VQPLNLIIPKEGIIADVNVAKGRTQFVWVKDKAGNEFVCPLDALKDPKKASDEELKNCVDDAKTVRPFAGG
jgi:hypothetical protein